MNLAAEAVLDADVDGRAGSLQPYAPDGDVLLTGGTGFVGVHLLAELLVQLKRPVHCLVRAESVEMGSLRLRAALEERELWRDEFDGRVVAVPGDLSKPHLGLAPEVQRELEGRVSAIYHCGAEVNFLHPYARLKAANVTATATLLKLATTTRLKALHFISSAVVLRGAKDPVPEALPLEELLPLFTAKRSGYAQSKWVAEKLVALASSRGVPTTVWRLGYVSGHSGTGVSSFDDARLLFLKLCVLQRAAPSLDAAFNLTPADYVARALVYLSRRPDGFGKTFHLINPETPRWPDVVQWVRDCGYAVEGVDFTEWLSQIGSPELGRRAADPVARALILANGSLDWLKNPDLDHPQGNVTQGLEGSNIKCPRIDAPLMTRYVAYFQRAGFLPLPDAVPPVVVRGRRHS